MKVAVLGSGAGALAVAADMSRHGRHTVMADFDDFRTSLKPVAESGGVTVSNDWHGAPGEPDADAPVEPVSVAADIPEALDGAELAVVVVLCSVHERWAREPPLTGWTSPDWSALPAPPCSRDPARPDRPLDLVRAPSRGGS